MKYKPHSSGRSVILDQKPTEAEFTKLLFLKCSFPQASLIICSTSSLAEVLSYEHFLAKVVFGNRGSEAQLLNDQDLVILLVAVATNIPIFFYCDVRDDLIENNEHLARL